MDSEFKKRLNIAIKGESVNSFAKKCGVRESLLRKYLTSATIPGMDKIIAIARSANIMIEWLATGVGPKRKQDGERFDFELLTLIIGGLDYNETSLEKKLSAVEKATIILYIFSLYSAEDLALDQNRFSLMDTIKGVYNIFSSFDGMTDTEKSREQAIKIVKRLFGKSLSEEGAEFVAQALIGAKLTKK